MRIISIITAFTLLLAFACKKGDNNANQKPLAQAFDKNLYPTDIRNIIPKGFSKEDSAITVSNYVDLWVKKQLLLQKAEENLTEEQKNVEKQLEDYRTSLLIYKYKQKFIAQKLDTTIDVKEIEDFYNNHSHEFKLSSNIVKAYVVRLPFDVPAINTVPAKLNSGKPADITAIKALCDQYGGLFQDFSQDWIFFYTIFNHIPLKIEDAEEFLKKSNFTKNDEGDYTYFLKIISYKLKNETSPFEMVSGNIKDIILNKKKNELIQELEKNIYQDALNSGKIKILNQKNK
jgi:hypothetical protein